jgi:L-ascorbate metabolism protein UlaG (beta-lactamase superfamily)
MIYRIISSGSKGNAIVLNGNILIDCGVSFKALNDVYKDLNIVLLTHGHFDHIKPSTVKKLASERPSLRFVCGEWLVPELIKCGVSKSKIDVVQPKTEYDYGAFKLRPETLTHNVPNFGWHIFIGDKKVFYATDTGNLDGIEAKGYDLYMVECNYEKDEIEERIRQKEVNGEFVYEYDVLNNHLDKAQTDEFILENIGENSEYVYLHEHEGG